MSITRAVNEISRNVHNIRIRPRLNFVDNRSNLVDNTTYSEHFVYMFPCLRRLRSAGTGVRTTASGPTATRLGSRRCPPRWRCRSTASRGPTPSSSPATSSSTNQDPGSRLTALQAQVRNLEYIFIMCLNIFIQMIFVQILFKIFYCPSIFVLHNKYFQAGS